MGTIMSQTVNSPATIGYLMGMLIAYLLIGAAAFAAVRSIWRKMTAEVVKHNPTLSKELLNGPNKSTKPKIEDEEREGCLTYIKAVGNISAFWDRESTLFNNTLVRYLDSITESPVAASEVCKAANRLVQAAKEVIHRHEPIQPIPDAAMQMKSAYIAFLISLKDWAENTLAAMETLANGLAPHYEYVQQLMEKRESAWHEVQTEEKKLLGRLGLSTQEIEALLKQTHSSLNAAKDDSWQPEPCTYEFSNSESSGDGDRGESTEDSHYESDLTATTCETDMTEDGHKTNAERTPAEETIAQAKAVSENSAEEKQGVATEQIGAVKIDQGADETRGAVTQSCVTSSEKLLILVGLILLLMGIVAQNFSNTPTATRANHNGSQRRDLSAPGSSQVTPRIDAINPGITEVTPRIEAICFSNNGESSICVQGEFAREGDIVGGFTVLKIYPDRVEFEKNGRITEGVFPPPRKSSKQYTDEELGIVRISTRR